MTYVAGERLFTRMNALMRAQRLFVSKLLSTLVTQIRPLPWKAKEKKSESGENLSIPKLNV